MRDTILALTTTLLACTMVTRGRYEIILAGGDPGGGARNSDQSAEVQVELEK